MERESFEWSHGCPKCRKVGTLYFEADRRVRCGECLESWTDAEKFLRYSLSVLRIMRLEELSDDVVKLRAKRKRYYETQLERLKLGGVE